MIPAVMLGIYTDTEIALDYFETATEEPEPDIKMDLESFDEDEEALTGGFKRFCFE
jgi:hypothetical protein